MFERLERMPDDPILGLMAAFRADADTRKVDLGVGVYRNDKGETPVLDAVRKAEAAVLSRQTSKTYVAPAGNPGFNQRDGKAGVRRQPPDRQGGSRSRRSRPRAAAARCASAPS